MKYPCNVYCFRLLSPNFAFFYRCTTYNLNAAYKKMLIELTHDYAYFFRDFNLKHVKHIYTIVMDKKTDLENHMIFQAEIKKAYNKYYSFCRKYKYALCDQWTHIHSSCKNLKGFNSSICSLTNERCINDMGQFCEKHTKLSGAELI